MPSGRGLEGGGWLTLEEAGGRVRFHVTRHQDGLGLYKVWIWGRGGRTLLGTMMPQGEMLVLERTLTRSGLQAAGCYPVVGGEVVMAFSFQPQEKKPKPQFPSGWQREETPSTRLEDPLLRQSLGTGEWLVEEGEGGFRLACRYQPKEEMGLVPLFCLCRWEELEGTAYLVWKFDEKGRPIVWDSL